MVGAGIFEPQSTARSMVSLIPEGVQWIKAAVASFEPQDSTLTLEDGQTIGYQQLVVPLAAMGCRPTTALTSRHTPGNWCRN